MRRQSDCRSHPWVRTAAVLVSASLAANAGASGAADCQLAAQIAGMYGIDAASIEIPDVNGKYVY